jgi:hypothetical protein
MEIPAAEKPGKAWRFVFEPRWLAWHAFAVIAVWGMLWLGDWQYHRALGGNGLSWAYTFEWPLFAAFGVVFWARTLRDEFRVRIGKDPDPKVIRELEAAAAEARALSLIDPTRPRAITSGPDLPATLGLTQTDDWVVREDDEADAEDDIELFKYNAYLARLHLEVKDHGKWHGLR